MDLSTVSTTRRPLVSVGMTAYNHEDFIARALESVLMQEVDFEYEIIIGEDCSQDSTREIILEYQAKYPDIIKPILYETNVGMKQNYLNIRDACKGTYRTTLEGDDYWITCDRMKKSVDFLENNPDYIAVAANWYTIDQNNRIIRNPFEKTYFFGREFTTKESQRWLLPKHTSTMMYRNLFPDYDPELLDIYSNLKIVGDRKLSLFLALHGNIYCFDNYIAARRIIKASGTSYYATTKRQNMYYVMYNWTEQLEEFARKHYGVELDYTEKRLEFWLLACMHFFKLPCLMHFRVMRSIYKSSKDKKAYRKALRQKIGKWIKKVYRGRSFLRVSWDIIKKVLKLPLRVFRFQHKTKIKQNSSKTSIDSFI